MYQRTRRALIALFLLATAAPVSAQAELVGVFVWEREESYFGGVSGIDFFDAGTSFAAVGDNGQTLIGTLERKDGVITSVTSRWIGGLRDRNGQRLDAHQSDAEGLALAPDGSWIVSFERVHRLVKYKDREAPGLTFPAFPMLRQLAFNQSLEAVAIGSDGALFAIAEGTLAGREDFPVFRFADGSWTVFDHLPVRDDFRPVGADFGPDGRLYILERRWNLPVRFSSRVTRFEVTGSGLENPQIILETEPGQHDNLEGLAVWSDGVGLRLTMVSDDNHRSFQRTELVEYRFTE